MAEAPDRQVAGTGPLAVVDVLEQGGEEGLVDLDELGLGTPLPGPSRREVDATPSRRVSEALGYVAFLASERRRKREPAAMSPVLKRIAVAGSGTGVAKG
jgi:hypothetical protein